MVFFVFIVSYNVFVVRGCQGLNFFLRRCKVYVKYYRVNFKIRYCINFNEKIFENKFW